jgi:hypothetical protein
VQPFIFDVSVSNDCDERGNGRKGYYFQRDKDLKPIWQLYLLCVKIPRRHNIQTITKEDETVSLFFVLQWNFDHKQNKSMATLKIVRR